MMSWSRASRTTPENGECRPDANLVLGGMRRNAKSITTSPEIVRNIHGLTEANFQLLTKLIGWLDGHEQQHTRYRMAMINRLTRVEAAISLILVSQNAQTQSKPPWYRRDKLEEDAKQDEEFIARQSAEEGMKMIRYIYGRDEAPEPRRDRRRKWSGWEI
jgi:hypothetical protein